MVYERLSVMQEQAALREFCVLNSLSAPTQVFGGMWYPEDPLPQEIKTWPN